MIKAIPEKMRKCRFEQGLNQADVCDGVKINIATYNQIENGRVGLRPKTAKKICEFLNRSFHELFEIVAKEG